MALTRKLLSTMGIEEDKIDQIIEAHADSINGLKELRDQQAEELEELRPLKNEVENLKAQVQTNADIKKKYDALEVDYNEFKDKVKCETVKNQKTEAYKKLLKDAGVVDKRIDSILKVTDLSAVELDDDAAIKDSEKLIENIKTEWSDFIGEETVKGVETPPNPKPDTDMDKETFSKLSLAEQMNFANANPDKYSKIMED